MAPPFHGKLKLFDVHGDRTYLNARDRLLFLEALNRQPIDVQLMGKTMLATGARSIEMRRIRGHHIIVDGSCIAVESAKKTKDGQPIRGDYRVVPVPPLLVQALRREFDLSKKQRLWPWSRWAILRCLKPVFASASITGARATARSLRHAYAINTRDRGVPLEKLSQCMGHESIETTMTYLQVFVQDELTLFEKTWCGEDDLWR